MGNEDKIKKLRLIAITDAPSIPSGWPSLIRLVTAALDAGLPALMLRDKTLSDAELLPVARELRNLTRDAGALLIVNRRLDLAHAIDADGVHLGATGPTLETARQLLGSGALIGYSAHVIDEALGVLARGADYITFSPVFATPSKAGILEPVGLTRLSDLARQAPGRVIALGGIDRSNITSVIQTGAAGAAVIRAILGAGNVQKAVSELLLQLT